MAIGRCSHSIKLLETMLPSSLKTTLFGLAALLLSAAPAAAQIVGSPGVDDHFGNAVATGDFNNDGYADLAVGVPGDDVGANEAGAVNVIYGTADGLDVPDNARWAQGSAGVAGAAEDFDWFGYSLAVGDFNGDNFDDLAIGVPYEDVGAIADAGAVNVLYGSTSGLQTAFNQLWVQGDIGTTTDEVGDSWGWAVAAGDFDNDGYDDLAVGAAYEDIGGTNEGGVTIVFGTSNGLEATGAQFWSQSGAGTGSNDDFDSFGFSLAVGNFDNDSYDDLAIGIIGEDAGGQNNAGGVAVMYGTNTGLSAVGSQLWSQATAGIEGAAEIGDQLGWSLTTGNFDNDNFDDLAAGAPYEDVGAISNAGAVNVIYGTAAGLSSTDNQLFSEATAGIPLFTEANDHFGFFTCRRTTRPRL